MNVLHVISSIDPHSGGPPEALRGLALGQRGAGLTVRVLATWLTGSQLSLADQLPQNDVAVRLVGPCWGPLGWCRGLSAAVRAEVGRADIVHVHGLWEEVQHQASRWSFRIGKPYLIRP